MKNNKGFSLVELIVVIAIMAILAAVAIPTFATFINRANEASDIDLMNNIEYAAELAYAAEDKNITKIEVFLTKENGTVNSVKIYVDNSATADMEVKQTGNTGTAKEKEMKELIAGTIDWNYEFKAKVADLKENTNWSTAWNLSNTPAT